MDWQSRSWHRERTYHSRDRKIEVSVSRRWFQWALGVSRYSEYTTLRIAVPCLAVFVEIAPGKEPPIGEMAVSWEVYTYGNGLGELELVASWGKRHWRHTLNPFHWSGYSRERLRADGEWDATPHYTDAGKSIDWYSEEHPYAITSEPTYYPQHHEGPTVSVEVWRANATCHVERSTRTRRWLPFWKRVEHWVYFHLDDEIGRGKGSWKGGTIGFSEAMLPGDSIADVVQRAARKGRGR